ncbi:MAG: four helix bundle protein [Alphaproteobacteria bacterium]
MTSERVKSYEDLRVWQDAMQLAESVYAFCQHLPKDEIYGLASQMKRAAVSIPSNIAEGSERNNTKELIHFLYIARGSLAELQTQIKLARRLHNITGLVEMEETGIRISRGLANLIKSLQKPSPATRHLPPVTLTE